MSQSMQGDEKSGSEAIGSNRGGSKHHPTVPNPADPENRPISHVRLLMLVWVALFLTAAALDRMTALAVRDHPILNKKSTWVAIAKSPGDFRFTLVIALLLLIFHKDRIKPAISLLLSGMLGGLIYSIIKWVVGRERPVLGVHPWSFHPFSGGILGIFTKSGLSFPSGHACLSFATATTLALALPRWIVLWFCLAAIVGGERVLENAHYLSDVVAGAGVGILCGIFTWRALNGFEKHRTL
jgi:undecaprenyl-diphosphatase